MQELKRLLSLLQTQRGAAEEGRWEEVTGLVPETGREIENLIRHPAQSGSREELERLAEEVEVLEKLLKERKKEILEWARWLQESKKGLRGYFPQGKPPARFVDRWLR